MACTGEPTEPAQQTVSIEPPGDDASPAEVALLFSAALETTRADVNAATLAQEAGEDRKVALGRTVLQLNEQHLGELRAQIEALLLDANDHPDGDGVWTTVVWTTIDREDRRAARSPRATARRARSAPTTKSSPQD